MENLQIWTVICFVKILFATFMQWMLKKPQEINCKKKSLYKKGNGR